MKRARQPWQWKQAGLALTLCALLGLAAACNQSATREPFTLPQAGQELATAGPAAATAAPMASAGPQAAAATTPTQSPPAAAASAPAASATPRPAATATPAAGSGPQAAAPQEAFIQQVAPLAQAEQADSGVPASFSMALAAAETSWGASTLMRQHNNYHMISCSTPSEGLPCVRYGDGMWNAYSSPLQAFLWQGRWLRGHAEFAEAFKHTDDVAAFTRLVAPCYVSCAGPFPQAFVDGVMNIVDKYNLRQYDKPNTPSRLN